MSTLDVAARGWKLVGDTTNSRFFEVRPGLLCAVPMAGSTDDERTATENRDYQARYFRALGRPGVMLVVMDGFVSQDGAARKVYRESDEPLIREVGLIATSLLARAIASFSIGIRQYRISLRVFSSLDAALAWATSYPGLGEETSAAS